MITATSVADQHAWIGAPAPWTARLIAMARVGLRMMFHDRLKLLGTVAGVVFAVVLAVQQLAILVGLLQRNTMFVDNAGADLWLAPPSTDTLQPGDTLTTSVLSRARTTPGVALAVPLVYAGATIKKSDGGSEPVTLIGTELPALLGGPWNIVAGDPAQLSYPDTLFFEDSERDTYGGINLNSVREVNGYNMRVGGFTWGLLPFGPAYAFGEVDLVRTLVRLPSDRMNYVLVKVRDGEGLQEAKAALAARVPEVKVLTRQEFSRAIVSSVLRQQLGLSFGVSTCFGLVIGFVIVSLSMFSSVLDNLREFGTLKAMGCTNTDLTGLLVVQSVGYALLGSFVGLGVVTFMTEGIRGPKLVPLVPNVVIACVPAVMLTLCALASGLALLRIRKIEPGMVFR